MIGALAGALLACTCAAQSDDWVAGELITINDDGCWCWFEGERAIIHDGELLVGSVAAGSHRRNRRGNIEVSRMDLDSGEIDRIVLHRGLQLDDHDSPALLALDDDHVLAVWAKHGPEDHFYYAKTLKSGDTSKWERIQDYSPSPTSRITYSNTFQLSQEDGRVYNFFRGLDGQWKPSYVFSDDRGKTWTSGNIVINVPSRQQHRPYVRYASDGQSRIHLFYTEGHPRDFDNSIYHIYYEGGLLYRSNGSAIGPIQEGIERPEDGTRVYEGDADHVAWVMDLRLDPRGNPVGLFSVQVNGAGLPKGQGGDDHRYFYASWTRGAWHTYEIAYAGSRLYKGEDDYTGLGVIDPNDPNTVFISTDADPVSGHTLVSRADNRRHYEIFMGQTSDGGRTWNWSPITRDSTVDNLRPVVPPSDDGTILLWLRGEYRSYTDYDLDVVALVDPLR